MTGASKVCKRCAATKPVDGFRPERRCRDGLSGICRACENARNARNSRLRRAPTCTVCGQRFERTPPGSKVSQCGPRCYVLARITVTAAGCWQWIGALGSYGYGSASLVGYDKLKAHQFAYETFVGPIPPGTELDHVCHSRAAECTGGSACLHRRCVNPAHLEPVARSENTRRGVRIGYFGNPNVCRKGHDWNVHPPGLARRGDGTVTRTCWVCRTERRTGRPHSCDKCATGAVA